MTAGFTESDAEEAALGWLESLGYTIRHGPEIAYNVDGGDAPIRGIAILSCKIACIGH
jgi:hypothetical protein